VLITSEIMYLAENFLLTWSVFCFQIHTIFMHMKDNVFSQCGVDLNNMAVHLTRSDYEGF